MRGASRKAVLVVWAFALSISAAYAQPIPGGAEAGRIEDRFQETVAPRVVPAVTQGLESTTPPEEAAAYTLTLASVSIVGSTVYDEVDLSPFYSAHLGKEVTLAKVFEIAAAITAKYGQDGYMISRAIVPPQEIEPSSATIQIQIIEGYVDEVRWPDFASNYRDLFSEYSRKITADRPLNIRTLSRYLLLANDLPGLSFESNLTASETNPGASTLIITGSEDKFSGYVSADNHGVKASGPYQATVGGTVSNLLGMHGSLRGEFTIGGPSENGQQELLYGSLRYSQILNSEGLTFFVDGNISQGEPGTGPLLALGYETKGYNVSAGLSYSIIRSREENLTSTIALDFKNSESTSLGLPATKDRLRIVRGELAYEKADETGGISQIALSASHGINGLGSTSNSNPVASRIPGVVDFFKVTVDASRIQPLPNDFSLAVSGFGQWTDDPLLSSQECGFGGRQFGRGFDSSIITGDRCLMGSLELRRNFDLSGSSVDDWLSFAQPYAFIDYGQIWNIDAPLGTPMNDDAASAGGGIRFGGERFSADLVVSTVVTNPASQTGLSQTRGWFKTTFRY